MNELPADFAELARDRLLRQRGDAEVVIDGDTLLVEIPGRERSVVSLHNVWRSIEAYRDRPQSLTGAVDDWARRTVMPVETPATPEALAASLKLLIKAPAFVEEMVERGLEVPVLSLVPGVAALFVADTEHHMRFLDADALQATGLSPTDAAARAVDNLYEHLRDQLEMHGDTRRMYTCGGHYEASLMLFEGFWDAREAEQGPLLVAIPARDLCLSAPADDPEAVAALEADVRDAFERDVPYLLVPYLYERREGAWQIARSAVAEEAAYTLLTVHADDVAGRSPGSGAEVRLGMVAPGLFTGLADPSTGRFAGFAEGEVPKEPGAQAIRARLLARRPTLTTTDGVTELRDEGGPAIDLLLHTHTVAQALGDDYLVGLPHPGVVLAAPAEHADALRRRVIAAYDEAGDDRLTTTLFREDDEGLHAWPAEQDCPECEARVSTAAVRCWRCDEPLYDNAFFRWVWESLALTVVLAGVLWAAGALTQWTTPWVLWGEVYLFAWVPRAVALGASRSQALATFVSGWYRWLIPAGLLYSLWQLPTRVGAWQAAVTSDGWTSPVALSVVIYGGLSLGLLWLCIDIARAFGGSALLPWAPLPYRRD